MLEWSEWNVRVRRDVAVAEGGVQIEMIVE
jgi:hypothetical protein